MPDIHVRLRLGKDDDIANWYEGLEHKSDTVRQALRGYVGQGEELARRPGETDARRLRVVVNDDNGELLAAIDQVVKVAVIEAMSRELALLPARINAAVCEALDQAEGDARRGGREDPELAARLDAQLDSFFD